MNAIQEAIATIKDWQVRDPETRFLDGYSMSGDEAWRACLHKVCTMLETIEKGTALNEAADKIEELQADMDRLQKHTDKLVAIATNVVRKAHRNDLYFIDCLRVDAASSLRLALTELSDYLREW